MLATPTFGSGRKALPQKVVVLSNGWTRLLDPKIEDSVQLMKQLSEEIAILLDSHNKTKSITDLQAQR